MRELEVGTRIGEGTEKRGEREERCTQRRESEEESIEGEVG